MAVKKTGLGKGLDSMIPMYASRGRAAQKQTSAGIKKEEPQKQEAEEKQGTRLLKFTEVEQNR